MKRDFFPPHEYAKKQLTGLSIFNLSSDEKIFLRPLSQLTEVIEHNGERFEPAAKIDPTLRLVYSVYVNDWDHVDPLRLPYSIVQTLLSWHFNVFNLAPELFVPIPSIEHP